MALNLNDEKTGKSNSESFLNNRLSIITQNRIINIEYIFLLLKVFNQNSINHLSTTYFGENTECKEAS